MIVIAPASSPQVYVPPLRGVLHPLAPLVMAAIRQHGPDPINMWSIINALAKVQKPVDRDHHESWRLRYWGAIRELQRVGLLFRHRSLIALKDFVCRLSLKSAKRLSRSVCKADSQKPESNAPGATAETAQNIAQTAKNELYVGSQNTLADTPETKSATPTMDEISTAASSLAQRPRPWKRKWTGFLHGERLRRRSFVQVPSGEVRVAYVVLRGKVLVFAPEDSERVFDRYDASEVRRIKHPAAVTLGSLKSGVRERPSAAKATAARRNGCQPCRAGSRPRGRPRRLAVPTGPPAGPAGPA